MTTEETKTTLQESEGQQRRKRHPEDQRRMDMVGRIPIMWPEIDERTEKHIDSSLLGSLRNLDYVARQRLMLLMSALHDDQHDNRPESRKKESKSLRTLVPLIEEIENTITEETFIERLSNAVFGLSREDQEKLMHELEASAGEHSDN